MSQINYSVTFDNNLLTSVSGLTILATNPYLPANRNLTIGTIARSDKSIINAAFYTKKTLAIRVGITRQTRDLVEQSYDSLLALIQGVEKSLIMSQSGTQRQYTATYADSVFHIDGGSYIELDLIFETSDHFGYDVNPTTLLTVSGYTSNYKSDGLTFDGSAPWQVPVIIIIYTSITSTGPKAVTIANASNGQSLVISRTWTTGDVLLIDARNKILGPVSVNGSPVSFTGAIPEFQKGIGYWVYSDTFAARTFNALIYYYRRYV